MSVLIKVMEMPTSCASCPCADDDARFCKATKEYIPMLGHPSFCPLVEVPPHGDLIDDHGQIMVSVTFNKNGKCRADLIAPTIIEAEGEENG